ncbi:hypothetical protein D3C76_1530400 [compost metagenome]
MRQPQPVHRLHRRALHQALTTHQRKNTLEYRGRQIVGLFIRVGGDQRHAKHHVRLVQHGGRLEVIAVDANGLMHEARSKM